MMWSEGVWTGVLKITLARGSNGSKPAAMTAKRKGGWVQVAKDGWRVGFSSKAAMMPANPAPCEKPNTLQVVGQP